MELGKLEEMMPAVRNYRQELETLNGQLAKTTLTGKISSLEVAETLFTYMEETQQRFSSLQERLVESLTKENLRKVSDETVFDAQVTIDILIRNLFERTADVGFLATDADIRAFLENGGEEGKDAIRARLVEYVKKYSVYDEILVLDTEGNVKAHLDPKNKVSRSNDPLVAQTLTTGEEYVETFRASDLQPAKERTLIYSAPITRDGSSQSEKLGVLCLCFGFAAEMEQIFKKLATAGKTMGLLDAKGVIIETNTPGIFPDGERVTVRGKERVEVLRYKEDRYLATTTHTKGYQGYMGAGWQGFAAVPLRTAFKNGAKKHDIDDKVLEKSGVITADLKEVIEQSEEINEDLIDVVINGEIIASKMRAYALNPILDNIRNISGRIHDSINRSVADIRDTVISSAIGDVKALSALAIDIMDRNLYERANDCRWWALTTEFRKLLAQPERTDGDRERMGHILENINRLYTVYTNLFVYDNHRTVVAVSNAGEKGLIGKQVDGPHINHSLSNVDSQRYFVSPFAQTPLYDGRPTYVYAASITGIESHRSLGGIGIVFDGEPEFKAMLTDVLPQTEEGYPKPGAFALFTDASGRVISATGGPWKVGESVELPPRYLDLDNGKGHSGIQKVGDAYYAVGASMSAGYREYKTVDGYHNDVLAIVFIKL